MTVARNFFSGSQALPGNPHRGSASSGINSKRDKSRGEELGVRSQNLGDYWILTPEFLGAHIVSAYVDARLVVRKRQELRSRVLEGKNYAAEY